MDDKKLAVLERKYFGIFQSTKNYQTREYVIRINNEIKELFGNSWVSLKKNVPKNAVLRMWIHRLNYDLRIHQ